MLLGRYNKSCGGYPKHTHAFPLGPHLHNQKIVDKKPMQVHKCIAPNGALGLITKCRALPFLGQHTHVSKSKRRRSKVLQKFEICFKMVKDEKDEKAEKRSGKGKW